MDDRDEALAYAAANFTDVNEAFIQKLLELAEGIRDAAAVDLGTGPADIPIRLSILRPQWKITAVDGAPAMLELAKVRLHTAGVAERVNLVLADAKSLPFPDDSFQVIVSNSLLHHVSDPMALWREIGRIAAPGALLCLRDLLRPESESQAKALVTQHAGTESALLQEEFYRSLLAAYTPDEVAEQLRQVGLGNLTVAPVSDRHFDVYGRIG